MKIVQINAVYGEKSTGNIVRDIHQTLKNAGYASQVVCKTAAQKEEDVLAISSPLGGKWHALMTRLTGKQGFYSRISTNKLLKRWKKDTPDILHLHNVHSNFLHLPSLFAFARRRNIPVVITLHDCWYFTGKCYHFLDNGCEKWKSECNACPKRKADIPSLLKDNSKWVFHRKKKMYDMDGLYIVGCSQWVSGQAKQSPMLAKAQISYIYNGVDCGQFAPRPAERKDNFVVVTMANKWFDARNEQTRRAVLDWANKQDSKLVIVGCNAAQQGAYAKAQNVVCVGYVKDRDELARLYNGADVFLNMTLVDTLPTVNIEAALCGTPIITYDSGGSGELVDEGKTGYVVTPLRPGEVVAALDKIKSGAITREDCRTFAKENFDKESNYQKYIKLYENIYNNHKGGNT